MATLSEDGKFLVLKDGSIQDIYKAFMNLECAKADLQTAQNKIKFSEQIINEAKKLGYLTPEELDQIEQKKYKEERLAREKEEQEAEEARKASEAKKAQDIKDAQEKLEKKVKRVKEETKEEVNE